MEALEAVRDNHAIIAAVAVLLVTLSWTFFSRVTRWLQRASFAFWCNNFTKRTGVCDAKLEKVELSSRAQRRLAACGTSPNYILEHVTRLGSTYHPIRAPAGYICLAIAENKITFEPWLRDKLATFRPQVEDMGYDDNRGCAPFRKELAALMSRHTKGLQIDPDHLCAAAGIAAVIELLLTAICDDGDGVLVPVSCFSGFKSNFNRVGVELVPGGAGVSLFRDSMDDVLKVFERDIEGARSRGVCVKALLTSNPHNPSGQVLPLERLLQLLQWTEEQQIHLIVDEVYANSVYADGVEFVSAAALSAVPTDRLHVIYGLAKDFAMAGARVGVGYSSSGGVRACMSAHVHGCEVALVVQRMVCHVLQDAVFTARHLKDHKRRLKEAHAHLLTAFARTGLPPPCPSQAGMFVVLDWRHLLYPTKSFEAERELAATILDETNVNLTPGEALGFHEAGWFRLCFAYVATDVLNVAVDRIAQCYHNLPKAPIAPYDESDDEWQNLEATLLASPAIEHTHAEVQ